MDFDLPYAAQKAKQDKRNRHQTAMSNISFGDIYEDNNDAAAAGLGSSIAIPEQHGNNVQKSFPGQNPLALARLNQQQASQQQRVAEGRKASATKTTSEPLRDAKSNVSEYDEEIDELMESSLLGRQGKWTTGFWASVVSTAIYACL